MRSDALDHIDGERYYLTCSCIAPYCMIAFDFFPKEITNDESDITSGTCNIYFIKEWTPSFWKRLGIAFDYIFNHKSFIINDVCVPVHKYKEFREIADAMERCCNKHIGSK